MTYEDGHHTKQVFVNPAYDIFNTPNYPRFTAILDHLNIAYEKQEFSYNFRCIDTEDNNNNWQAKLPLFLKASNFLQLFRPHYFKLVYYGAKVGKLAHRFMQNPDSRITFYDFLTNADIPESFIRSFFIPVFARPWGLKPSDMCHFPAEIVLQWIDKNKALTPKPVQWQAVSGGAKTYVKSMVEQLQESGVQFKINIADLNINRQTNAVFLHWNAHEMAEFDHVVIATNPKIAKHLLQNIDNKEWQALDAFQYQRNKVMVHADSRFLPAKKSDWSYFDVAYDYKNNDTYNSIWFGQRKDVPVFATNYRNLPFEADPDKIYAEYKFEQPVLDANTAAARRAMQGIQGNKNTWYTGCYLNGTSHHEDAIESAHTVATFIENQLKLMHV